jgi:hypothetical protein
MPFTHRKVKGKQCVYKKSTGKKIGCTTGPLQKYLAALAINANESKTFKKQTITQKDILAGVRKPMPPPSKSFKDKKKYTRQVSKRFDTMYEQAMSTLGVIGRNTGTPGNLGGPTDTSFTAEGEYAQGQDIEGIPPVQDGVDREQIIHDIIGDIEDLNSSHNWNISVNKDLISAMADSLREVGIEPTDLDYAATTDDPGRQENYLMHALKDLKAMTQNVMEDESDPADSLPMGSTTAGTAASPGDNIGESAFRIGEVILDNPYGTGRKHFQGIDRIEAVSKDDALNKFIRQLVVSKKITTRPEILYRNAQENGVSVVKIEDTITKPKSYWWQDKD